MHDSPVVNSEPGRVRAADGLPGLYQQSVPPTVLADRRARVVDRIGSGGVALLQGAPHPPGSGLFRQSNEFYHLTGVEVPHTYLTIHGTSGTSALYLPHRDPDTARVTGEYLHCDDPAQVSRLTGVDAVRPIEALGPDLSGYVLRTAGLRLMVPLSPPEGMTQSRDDVLAATGSALADPWCNPTTAPAGLVARMGAAFPGVPVENLSPVLDDLRAVKDPTEIGLLRWAGQLCAAGITEAMRSTEPGRHEFELAATAGYVFAAGGARGDGYRAIVAGGTNAWHGHYGRQSSRLADGDLVLMDYAPDFAYYTSDIGRMWPVNGRFSDAQRALYSYIVTYHRALLRRLRPGAVPEVIMDEVAAEMAGRIADFSFGSDLHRRSALAATDFRGHLSHPVGMSVHDVGSYRTAPLRAGTVISIDPMLWIEPEHGYVRCEDTVVITDDGCETFTAAAPLDCDEIEAMMQEPGILQRLPTLTAANRPPAQDGTLR